MLLGDALTFNFWFNLQIINLNWLEITAQSNLISILFKSTKELFLKAELGWVFWRLSLFIMKTFQQCQKLSPPSPQQSKTKQKGNHDGKKIVWIGFNSGDWSGRLRKVRKCFPCQLTDSLLVCARSCIIQNQCVSAEKCCLTDLFTWPRRTCNLWREHSSNIRSKEYLSMYWGSLW